MQFEGFGNLRGIFDNNAYDLIHKKFKGNWKKKRRKKNATSECSGTYH